MMKKVKKLEDLPQDLIRLLMREAEFEDDDEFDDCEEIYHYIMDWVGFRSPKKKGEWYVGQSYILNLGNYKIAAQYKQYIKDYDLICDKEYDCLLFDVN